MSAIAFVCDAQANPITQGPIIGRADLFVAVKVQFGFGLPKGF